MPTTLPNRPATEPDLPWLNVGRLAILVARVRLIDLRLHVLVWWGAGFADDSVLRLMRRWLKLHDAIAILLPALPEPEHVAQVRVVLRGLSDLGIGRGVVPDTVDQ
jgi:hypothetical protein